MILKDKVYGEENIKENTLIELINSKEIQRLKGVSQYGIPDEYYHKSGFSRYEHSLGVLVILRRLRASITEQIAGLLHDISHTAFSHVFDWVIGNYTKEDYQDQIHSDTIKNSSIPSILKRHGFDYKDVTEIERFSLLEKEIPSLCADRFDYTVRELKDENKLDIVNLYISNITHQNGQMVFKTKESAETFAMEYARLQREHWAAVETRARYHILADILKKSIDKGIISFEDLRKTDYHVIGLLNRSQDKEILYSLNLLKNGFKIIDAQEGIKLRKKFRYVDPEILVDDRIKILSEISPQYKNFLETEKRKANSIANIKILEA
jgi:HD superfamily phosphohydrolase